MDIKILQVDANLFMKKSSFGFEEKPNESNALPKECKKIFYTTNEQLINKTRRT